MDMKPDIAIIKQTEDLYEDLARAIDNVRSGREENVARECEAQFLIKLSFLALREIDDPEKRRGLIELASRDLG